MVVPPQRAPSAPVGDLVPTSPAAGGLRRGVLIPWVPPAGRAGPSYLGSQTGLCLLRRRLKGDCVLRRWLREFARLLLRAIPLQWRSRLRGFKIEETMFVVV